MALYNAPRDPPLSVLNPSCPPLYLVADRPARYGDGWIPFILAAIAAVGIMALIFPRSLAVVGDNSSFGASKVQSFAPGPVPVTERRPAPAPV